VTPAIRVGRPSDEPALRGLQRALREPSPDLLAHGLRVGGVAVSLAEDRSAAAHSVVDDRPVGYVLHVGGDDRHVAELVVAPAFRREGRARRLLRHVCRVADGRVTLLVHPDNEPARALYDSLGFDVIDRRPGFYDDADALVMAVDASAPDSRGES
jgi:ribosomal-protein-alanine N-acetyltransferase